MITQETVDRLIQFEEPVYPVVSLYATVDVDPAVRAEFPVRVMDLLDRIRPMADDTSLDHAVRMSLRDDIARIEKEATLERPKPGGAAFFACSGRGFFQELALPYPVHNRIILDATPWVRPLVSTLDEHHRTYAVLVDRSRARVWEAYLDEVREIDAFRDPVLRMPSFVADRAEDRVRNKSEELTKRHYRRVAGVLERFRRQGRFELLVIGGQSFEIPDFMRYLSPDLRERVVGTFGVDLDAATATQVRENVAAIVGAYEREEEQALVDACLADAGAGRPAAIGLPDCLWAGSVAAIQTLLVGEGGVVPGVVCDRDGWLALSGQTCPFCGEAVRQSPDVIDELVAAVIDEDGAVKHVQGETALGDRQAAAMLRFPLPPHPGTDG